MTYAEPQHYHVKVRVYNESIDFGKGVAELLQRIEATGSLSAAYKAMGMSASKAWKILRRAEAELGFALGGSTAGGKSGGGSGTSGILCSMRRCMVRRAWKTGRGFLPLEG